MTTSPPTTITTTTTEESSTQSGVLTSSAFLSDFITTKFPQDHVVQAIGYGSGVFSQTLKDGPTHSGMLDIILIVDDALQFHTDNMKQNPQHYASWLKMSGPSSAAWLQRQFPLPDAKILFHNVDANEDNNNDNDEISMKYGVVHVEDIQLDLINWTTLYLAGRLHKPTLPVFTLGNHPSNPNRNLHLESLQSSQHSNLQAAMAASLLLLPCNNNNNNNTSQYVAVSWPQLYSQIASLSYTGDFRMQVGGEDPLKISKLVQAPGQLERFHTLYNPIWKPLEQAGLLSVPTESTLEWNPTDTSTRNYLIQQLPLKLQTPLALTTASSSSSSLTVSTQQQLLAQQKVLATLLASIVAPPARYQAFKSISTFGFRKSIRYAAAKLSKGWGYLGKNKK